MCRCWRAHGERHGTSEERVGVHAAGGAAGGTIQSDFKTASMSCLCEHPMSASAADPRQLRRRSEIYDDNMSVFLQDRP
jgi:hypothetical protein